MRSKRPSRELPVSRVVPVVAAAPRRLRVVAVRLVRLPQGVR